MVSATVSPTGKEKCEECVNDQTGASQDAGCSTGAPICDEADTNQCIACEDNQAGSGQDLGCSLSTPLCIDVGTPVCSACVDDASGSDTDTGCTAGEPSCVDGMCQGCEISLIGPTLLDGSFEDDGPWVETGMYTNITNCNNGAGCAGTVGGATFPVHGSYFAWMGGIDGFGDRITTVVNIPANAKTLSLKADTNFQTDDNSASNEDSATFSLIDQFVATTTLLTLWTATAEDARTSNAQWDSDGVDVTADVSSLAGTTVRLKLAAVNDNPKANPPNPLTNDYPTDFFIDNIRVTVNVCE